MEKFQFLISVVLALVGKLSTIKADQCDQIGLFLKGFAKKFS